MADWTHRHLLYLRRSNRRDMNWIALTLFNLDPPIYSSLTRKPGDIVDTLHRVIIVAWVTWAPFSYIDIVVAILSDWVSVNNLKEEECCVKLYIFFLVAFFILLHIGLDCLTTRSCEQHYHFKAFPERISSFPETNIIIHPISWANTSASILRCLAKICSSLGIASPQRIWIYW